MLAQLAAPDAEVQRASLQLRAAHAAAEGPIPELAAWRAHPFLVSVHTDEGAAVIREAAALAAERFSEANLLFGLPSR